MAWWQVVEWALHLCAVLGYLHAQTPPFVFRDVKLANIIVDARTGRPVLIDFGIARHLVSTNGTAIGTWGYVPYEQVLGKVEPRSDICALGATLHALLTGRHPDAEYTRLQRHGHDVEAVMRTLFPRVDALVPGVPSWLAAAVERATAFEAADRYPDIAAFADDLRHSQISIISPTSGSPLTSMPVPATVNQHRTALSSAVSGAHAGLVQVGAAGHQLSKEAFERTSVPVSIQALTLLLVGSTWTIIALALNWFGDVKLLLGLTALTYAVFYLIGH